MRKSGLFLAMLLMVSLAGCPNNDEDLTDTITQGTWRVDYIIQNNDEDTSLFSGYVFTFQTNGTVAVTRPNEPPAQGTWNEYNGETRLTLDFGGNSGLLQRLNEDWVVDYVIDDELALHEPGAPLDQLRFEKI
jgi:hypothetical protein